MHALFQKADKISHDVIGAAIEVHRRMGSGLIESIYERCMVRELELRSIPAITQQLVRIQYTGIIFDEPLRFDILVDSCLLLELKAVEALHPFSKAQPFSYMKVVDAGRIAHQLSPACPQERHLPADLAGSKSDGRKRR